MSELDTPLLNSARTVVAEFNKLSSSGNLGGLMGSFLDMPLQGLRQALADDPDELPLDAMRAVINGFDAINTRGGLAGAPRIALNEPIGKMKALLAAVFPTPVEAAARIASLEAALQPFLFLGASVPARVPGSTVVGVSIARKLTQGEMDEFAAHGTPVASPHTRMILSVDGLTVDHLRAVQDVLPETDVRPYPAARQDAIGAETVNLDTLRPGLPLLLKLAALAATAEDWKGDRDVANWVRRLQDAGLVPQTTSIQAEAQHAAN